MSEFVCCNEGFNLRRFQKTFKPQMLNHHFLLSQQSSAAVVICVGGQTEQYQPKTLEKMWKPKTWEKRKCHSHWKQLNIIT